MTRTRITSAIACTALLVGGAALRADVRTQERSQIKFEGMLGKMFGLFGGKAAREGIVATTAVKGDRKLTMNDNTGQIVDLTEEKIYDLDVKKKTYTVTTFAELRQKMKEAQAKAEEEARKAQKEGAGEQAQPEQTGKEVEIDFDMKETGQQKTIAGHNTREVVMTVVVREKGKTLDESGGVVLTSSMWLAPTIAALNERTDFERRYFEKLYGPMDAAVSAEQMAAVMAIYPWVKQATERMNQEKVNMEGTALAVTTMFEGVKSAEQLAQEKEQQKSSGGGGFGGMLARRVMKKEEPKPRATVFTLNHEVLSVSTDAGDLAIPAGFKQK